MDKFYELSEETTKGFFEVFNKKAFPLPIKFQFIGDSKQKSMVNITKVPDKYNFITSKELLVSINEELYDVYDDESLTILFEQEIDKIVINLSNGKIKMVKTDLNTFSSIINKYGVEKVSRANKVEELYQEQKEDKNSEEFIA